MTTLLESDLQKMKEDFDRDGYVVVRQLFSPEEVEEIKETFEEIHQKERAKFFNDGVTDPNDPLFQYPRVVHPHRFNATALRYLLHPPVKTCLMALFGEEPVATQSMYYFKSPGARGQALHQDNGALLVDPGVCIGAWTAIDKADRENGGMMVVPGSNRCGMICAEEGDAALKKESFSYSRTPVPKGMKVVDVPMEPGDTLFFGGFVIHGSGPNRTKDRFRRSFIGHYAAGSMEKISKFYLPLIKMDGTEYEVPANVGGGPCGDGWEGAVH